jgi:hypothetical protein
MSIAGSLMLRDMLVLRGRQFGLPLLRRMGIEALY